MAKKTFTFDELGGKPGKVQSPAEKTKQMQMNKSIPAPAPMKQKAMPTPAATSAAKPGLKGLADRKKQLKGMGY